MSTKSILVAVSVLLILTLCVQAEGWNIKILSEDFGDGNFQISGKYVTWHEWDGNDYEIFFYDGNSIIQVTDNNYPDRLFALAPTTNGNISGPRVVWYGKPDPNTANVEIFLYDHTTSTVTQITNNNFIDVDPRIEGSYITWYEMTNGWLMHAEPNTPSTCNEAIAMGYVLAGDNNTDCRTNLKDLAILGNNWLNCIEPNDPNCVHPWL